jgi:hypothetical protein
LTDRRAVISAPSMTPPLRPLCLLGGLALALAARADTTLAPSSPFAPPDGAAAVATENQPLELRGIMQDGGGYRFSVYDPVKKSGQWVRLNEPGHDFTVKTHDAAQDTITLDYQGRRLTLPLHSAKVVGVAVPEPSAVPGPRAINGTFGVGPQPKPGSPEEAARFNRAVEEINRRRALREKGPVPTPNPPPK